MPRKKKPKPNPYLPQNVDPETVQLKDITWGGKIRVEYQGAIWSIAADAAYEYSNSFYGSMLSSEETTQLRFLDGGVSNSRGFWNSSGMGWSGTHATAYMLYEMGLDPHRLLRRKKLPTHEELKAKVVADRKAAQERREAEAAAKAAAEAAEAPRT